MEGEVIEFDDELDESQTTTKYQLTGIVVHSGQASGGHYFSYILHKYVNYIANRKMHQMQEIMFTHCNLPNIPQGRREWQRPMV